MEYAVNFAQQHFARRGEHAAPHTLARMQIQRAGHRPCLFG
jgi:hypothetical protein